MLLFPAAKPMTRRRLLPALGLVAGTCVLALLTLSLGSRWAFPDLSPLLLCYVVLRWPRAVPVALPLVLGLMADLLFGRPPGSGALAMLLAAEVTRAGRLVSHHRPNWHVEMAVAVAVCSTHALALAVFGGLALVTVPSLTGVLVQAAGTALAYPLLWVLLRFVLRARPIEPRGVQT